MKYYLLCFLAFLLSCFLGSGVNAATLSLDPASGQYAAGDTFGVKIRISNDENECINAAEVSINFSKEELSAIDFATGDSIFPIWIEKPGKSDMAKVNESGTLTFSGGAPGGYCGRIPGDPGDSNILGEMYFKVLNSSGAGKINFLNNTKVLLNDGLGTEAKISLNGAEFEVISNASSAKKEWEEVLKSDKISPDPFVVEISRESSVYDGKYFIIFSATDKQTGIDHYEVLETKMSDILKQDKGKSLFNRLFRRNKKENWKIGASPYLLVDQTLLSVIKVKAVDKAGNEKIVEYTPPQIEKASSKSAGQKISLNIYLILGIILVLLLGHVIKKRKVNKDKNIG